MKLGCAVLAAFVVVLGGGCRSEYRGDGDFTTQTREYSSLAKSNGFTLALPSFRPTADHVAEYRLDGLPVINTEMTVAVVTLIPAERIPPSELETRNFDLPGSHKIACELVDTRTGRTVMRQSTEVNALPMTSLISLRHAPFVKEVMLVKTEAIPRRAKLALRLRYEIGVAPLDRDMFVLIMNESPLL